MDSNPGIHHDEINVLDINQNPFLFSIAERLQSGYQSIVIGNFMFVPQNGNLSEVSEMCGIDEEMFFETAEYPGFWILEHPGEGE